MVALVPCTLLGGVGFGLELHEAFDLVDTSVSGTQFPRGAIAFQLFALPFGLVTWAYIGLFVAWLYHAGRFADLHSWPAVRSRTLGAFSPLIPIVNLWWPYEAIRDCFPPGARPRVTLWWFVLQLVLPAPTLGPPALDTEHSYVVAHESGVANRIAGVFTGAQPDQMALFHEAEQQISGAAQKSDLSERAKANTTDMLTKLFNRLGYQQVTITYRDAPQ